MTPRRRRDGHEHLPPNLYPRTRGRAYNYRDPVTGVWSYIPGPERSAIAEARRRNAGHSPTSSTTVGHLLEQWRETYLQGAETTLAEADRIIGRYRRAWGSHQVRTITRQALTNVWETLTPHAAAKHRQLWISFQRWCVARGELDTNEAELTLPPRLPARERTRHTDAGYAAIYAAAPDWLQIAMELAVASLQRRGDLVRLTRDDVRDGVLYVRQAKTGTRLGIRFTPESRLGRAVRRALSAPVFGSTLTWWGSLVRVQSRLPTESGTYACSRPSEASSIWTMVQYPVPPRRCRTAVRGPQPCATMAIISGD